MMKTEMIDEQLMALAKKYNKTQIGIGFLWGVYATRNIGNEEPVSFVDFERELSLAGSLANL